MTGAFVGPDNAVGPEHGVPAPRTARADLLALLASGRALRTDLGPVTRRESVRHSAVLVLLGPLVASDHHDPGHADVDLLLTRRSDALRHHPGQVAFPGGGLDEGEDAATAALREAVEETGLDPVGVEVLGSLPDLPVVVSGNVVTPVLAWWRASSELVADGVETAEAFRVPLAQLVDPGHRGSVTFQRSPGSPTYTGPAFDVAGQVVWGFTAYVLDGLLDALGWAVPWDADRVIALPAGR